jgi:hypothetical protein
MFERIARGWHLAGESWAMIREDKSLLIFPVLAFFTLAIILVGFAVPSLALGGRFLHGGSTRADHFNGVVVMFVYYLVNYSVVMFFNVALISQVLDRLDGRPGDVGSALSFAASRLPAILGYAAIAATVGVILRLIQERVGFIGQIITGLIGIAWSVSVTLVAPVLAAEEIGPMDAIGRSVTLIKESWGEGLVSEGTVHSISALVIIAVVAVGGGISVFMFGHRFFAFGLMVAATTALAVGVLLVLQETLSVVVLAMLYRYANGETTGNFDKAALEGAFRRKAA